MNRPAIVAIAFAACIAIAGWLWLRADPPPPRAAAPSVRVQDPDLPPGVTRADTLETAHYRLRSTATRAQTEHVARAAESLYAAYRDVFREAVPDTGHPRLRLMLYRNRAEFQARNTSSPWAEAFYRRPWCHAYYAEQQANPDHWMVHEATHQLNAEVAHFPKAQWIDEGLATYFAASRIRDGLLHPGDIDPDAYPIWWLEDLRFSGDLQRDIRDRRFIPLRDIATGTGPPIGGYVNLYYVEFWSLTHFLFHGDGGRHAEAYKRLIASGGGLREFEATIGALDRIERDWYADLMRKSAQARAGDDADVFEIVLPAPGLR